MSHRKRNWIIAAVAAAALCVALFMILSPRGKGGPTGQNLLQNGDFSALRADGLPENWYTDAYVFTAGFTSYSMAEEGGANVAHIVNHDRNDARFAQIVKVSPDSMYCLKGQVKASAVGGLGANLSVEGIYVFSESAYDTGGEWRELRLYGRTGKGQTAVTVFARLGGYSGESTGEAYFRDISLFEVDSVPAEYPLYEWFTKPTAPSGDADGAAASAWPYLAIIALSFLGMCWGTRRFALTGHEADRAGAVKRGWAVLGAGLVLAAGLRVALALLIPGYGVDVGCFTAWGNQMAQGGARAFYAAGGFCDYPPGYILVLGALGWIGRLFGTGATEFLIKLPSILCDIAAAALLYRFAAKRVPVKAALALAMLYAFNPLAIVAGAAWGQSDSVMALGILLTVIFAIDNKWYVALPAYMLTVLMKPQALMFGPLGLIALAAQFFVVGDKKRLLRDALIGVGAALALAVAVIAPFSPDMESPLWIIDLYRSTMGYYANASVNACNLYFLFGQNWAGVGEATSLPLRLTGIVMLCAGLVFIAAKQGWFTVRRDGDAKAYIRLGCVALALALAVACVCIPLTFAAFGACCIALSLLICAGAYLSARNIRHLPLLGGVALILICNTGAMMHERYLFAAVPLLLLSCAIERDKRVYLLCAVLSAAAFLNVGCVLDRGIRIGGSAGHLNAPVFGIASDSAALEYIAAFVNCALTAFAGYTALSICCAGRVVRLELDTKPAQGGATPAQTPFNRPEDTLLRPKPLQKLKRVDWLLMLITTAVYTVVALVNLGSTTSPQTFWRSQAPQESVVLDVGQSRDIHMLYFGGIHNTDSNFTVQSSEDGENWGEEYWCEMREGNCFQWKYLTESYQADGNTQFSATPITLYGRYVRINAQNIGLTLYEIILRDPQTQEKYPITVLSGGSENLKDEQDTLTGQPGWYNSMYFDEIYHARTGYEHWTAMRGDLTYRTYETSHPPLGKVLMAFSIGIFGMTPFGWRFAGAIAGAMMLPGMYILGKMLTKRRWAAFAAMFLLAADCMHFTQTRIATIDSFVVLFIIWSMVFMIRYALLDYWRTAFWRTLVPLALSGVFMGLACASKWTGCYAGVGLAVIFFWTVWRRLDECLYAKNALRRAHGAKERLPKDDKAALTIAASRGIRRIVVTLACCLVFFIAVPLAIYYLSYIPFFLYTGGVTVKRVIQAAVGDYFTTGAVGGMLGYHGTPGLGMDHPFYSPWYQWPVIGKPMWYCADAYEPAGFASTIYALGNPAVWWGGLAALAGVAGIWAYRHIGRRGIVLRPPSNDMRPALLLLGFAAQYLPWVLVPRGMYIYHYFPCVPFIILCAALCFDMLADALARPVNIPAWPQRFAVRWNGWFGRPSGEKLLEKAKTPLTLRLANAPKYAMYVYLALALALFVAFFPYASGRLTSVGWLRAMQWFNGWIYY